MQERIEIADVGAAALFANTRARALLLELAGRAQSSGELVAATGMSPSLLAYYLGRLRRFGLVEIARERPRHGRPVKYYRAVAASFFVPSSLSPGLPGDALSAELRACLERARLASGDEGVLYWHETGAGPRMRRIAGASTAAELWSVLNLSAADARALAEELRMLFRRYEKVGGKGGSVYLVHAALARR